MGIDKDSKEKAEDLFNSFENLLRTIDAFPKKLSINSKLPEESIMSFLKVMTGFKFGLYSAPKEGMSGVSQYVSTKFIEKGKPMKLGEREVQALTINSFPSETYSGILFSLLALPCSFRICGRFACTLTRFRIVYIKDGYSLVLVAGPFVGVEGADRMSFHDALYVCI